MNTSIIEIILYTYLSGFLPIMAGWLLDVSFGDPMCLPHPIVWFGRWISFWEKRMNYGKHCKFNGAVLAVGSIVGVYAVASLLLLLLEIVMEDAIDGGDTYVGYGAFAAYIILNSVCVFYCLAGKTLRKEVNSTFEAVECSLDEGRTQVARIVGRDTSELDEQEIRTAALETLAENMSDGVVAPLFWLFLLGVPGMLAYKMVNTLDSMIGYQNERYREFGCWAAKIDDAANYVPARLTALLIGVAGWLKGHKGGNGPRGKFGRFLSFVASYGPQHASPNSGWPEAALAAILNCRFGGPHYYFGEYFYKPFIGYNDRKLTCDDVRFSLEICFCAEVIMVALVLSLGIIVPCLNYFVK